jgi:hypothetical protein
MNILFITMTMLMKEKGTIFAMEHILALWSTKGGGERWRGGGTGKEKQTFE